MSHDDPGRSRGSDSRDGTLAVPGAAHDDADRWPTQVFADLPRVFRVLLPEIDELAWHEETRADCRNCVMAPAVSGDGLDTPWSFHPDGRCCTFQPGLANFLAGRALRRGGRGAELIAARVARRDGVSAWGIRPSAEWRETYLASADDRFGRDLSLRCHYWVGGDHACGIWHERPSTCRTWFCKHDHGLRGAAVWAQLQRLLAHCESVLANFCIVKGQAPLDDSGAQGDPDHRENAGLPAPAGPAADEWLAWYRECAGRVDQLDALSAEELARVLDLAPDASGDPALRDGRDDLVTLSRRRPDRSRGAVPEVVVPAVEGTWPEERGVRISGYSRYDTVIAPISLFAFLAKLDGARTWRRAQAELVAEGHEPISDELIAELHRVGAIEAPGTSNPTVITRTPFPLVGDG